MPSSPEIRTQQRIALVVAVSVLIFQFIPGVESPTAPGALAERVAIAVAWGLYALLLSTSSVVRGRAWGLFEVLLYVTGLWTVRIAASDAFSAGSVLSLVMSTFGLGLGFRDADRLARFYLTMLGTIVGVHLLADTQPRTEPTLVLAVLGTIMAVAYLVARARDEALGEANVLALVASHVHNGVSMLDPQGKVSWINDGFTRMVGLELGQVIGRTFLETLQSPPTPAADLDRLRHAISAGKATTLEAARMRPDASLVWVAIDLTPVRGPSGALERFVVIETDVSAAHAYVAEIQDAMSELLFVTLADGTIRSANHAACEQLGVGPDDLVGQNLRTRLTTLPLAPDEHGEVENTAAPDSLRVLSTVFDGAGTVSQGVDIGLRAAGSLVVPVHLTVSALPAIGDIPRRLVFVARDVRERRRLERERVALERKSRQAQKLESLGVLAGGIAHDFNNLLVGIVGYASLLREELATRPQLLPLVTQIEDSAQRAAELTRQMLAYSGRGRFVIEPMDVSRLAEEMHRLVAAAMSKRAELRLELAPDLPPVEGDKTQVRQVLMNLLTNASDALQGRDGVITVRTDAIDATRALLSGGILDDDLPPGRYVRVAVTDTGAGMSDTVRKKMFEPFFTTKATGRGLGLAATLGIVRGHRGAIRVTSEEGVGTTVTVLLPATKRALPAESPAPAAVPERMAGARILVADDEPAVLEFVALALRKTGADVVVARDGQECVDRFAERPASYDLVILDLTMPRMNGAEALEELRRIRPDVRVLLSSGYSEQEAAAHFAGAGAAGFLQKPYRVRQLLAQVRPLMGA